MTYKGKNGSFPAGEKVEIKDFELEVSAKNLSSEGGKIVTTFAYKGKKAIFTKVVGGDITSTVEEAFYTLKNIHAARCAHFQEPPGGFLRFAARRAGRTHKEMGGISAFWREM